MTVRAFDGESEPPDPEKTVNFTVPHPITVQDGIRIVRLARDLGLTVKSDWVAAGGTAFTKVWTRDVVHSSVRAAYVEFGDSQAETYAAVRRALRACVDPEFRKAFWSARLLGGYEAAGAFLLANAPKRRVNRTSKDVREALDAAWCLHDPDALQPILDALNAISPGTSAKVNGYAVRRGKAHGNDYRWWISHPYLGRELSLPGEPRRLLRPLWEAALLATMGAERPRRPPRR